MSGNTSRRGGRAQDGVILRAKRHPQATARDRARAYAFERIPPSVSKSPEGATVGIRKPAGRRPWTANHPNSVCSSSDGEHNGDSKTMTATFRPAPVHGGTVGCLAAAKDGGHKGCRGIQGQHVMHPAAVGSSASTPFTVAPSCKIDLRGCSRRPLPLPLVPAVSESGRGALPQARTSTQGAGLRSDGSGGRRREVGRLRNRHRGRSGLESGGNENISLTAGRLGTGNNGGCTGRFTNDTTTDAVSPDQGVVAAALRPLNHSRWRKVVARDDGSLSPLKSEAQDMDELTSLLRVSRNIFRKTEGFDENGNRPEEMRVSVVGNCTRPFSSASTVESNRSGDVVSTQGHKVELGHTHDVSGQLSSSAAAGTAPRQSIARKSNSPPPDYSLKSRRGGASLIAGSGGRTSTTRSRVGGRLAIDHDKSLRQGQRSVTAPTRTRVLEGSRGWGGGNDDHAGNGEDHTHRTSIIEGDGAHSGLEAVENVEGTPAPVKGDEPSDAPDEEKNGGQTALCGTVTAENRGQEDGCLPISVETFDPTTKEEDCTIHPPEQWVASPPLQAHVEENDATQQAADLNNALAIKEGGCIAGVVDAANWNENQDEADNGGWAYDEATSSWYAAAIVGGGTNDHGEGNGDAEGGWRYDEQNASWHQDASVWQMLDPQEPQYAQIPESAAATTGNVADNTAAASGDGHNDARRRGSRRKPSRKLLLDLDIGENVRGQNWTRDRFDTRNMFISRRSA